MKRIWHHWEKWECVPAGMHNPTDKDPLVAYRTVLAHPDRFRQAIARVFSEWPNSCEQFLTNTDMNRVAWLGQAAVCIETGVGREYRTSFYELTDEEQIAANKIAAEAIVMWESKRGGGSGGVSDDVEQPGLF